MNSFVDKIPPHVRGPEQLSYLAVEQVWMTHFRSFIFMRNNSVRRKQLHPFEKPLFKTVRWIPHFVIRLLRQKCYLFLILVWVKGMVLNGMNTNTSGISIVRHSEAWSWSRHRMKILFPKTLVRCRKGWTFARLQGCKIIDWNVEWDHLSIWWGRHDDISLIIWPGFRQNQLICHKANR